MSFRKHIEKEFLVCISTFSPRPRIGLYSSLGSKAKRFVYRYDGSFVTSIVQLDVKTSVPALSQKEVCLLSHVPSIFKTDHNLTDKRKEMTCPNVHCPWRDLNVDMGHLESTGIARRKLLRLNTCSDSQP